MVGAHASNVTVRELKIIIAILWELYKTILFNLHLLEMR